MSDKDSAEKTQTEKQSGASRRKAPEIIEKGVTRRHTFFCVDRKRHVENKELIEAVPKTITVLGRQIEGWIVTTEEPVIDKTITLAESMEGIGLLHDTE
jgi:hypothetical protein